ncbi:MAG TPA: hypothetical protein VFV45_06855 [Rubrobacteraceae bacterium]|nr:hypothetical protein [Rubrobacteraceae bacterium]
MPLVTQRNRKWWTVVAMALTTLMMTIDFNGITAALPTIGRDLDTSTAGLQWTINAYLLALAAPSVAAGRLAGILWPSQGAAHRHLRIRDRLRGVWPGSNQLVVDLRPGLLAATAGAGAPELGRRYNVGSDNEGFHAVLEIWVVFCCVEWE